MTIEDVKIGSAGSGPELLDLIPTPRTASLPAVVPGPLTVDGRPLRVLAIGINFGPEHTGIAPYTTQLCEHLVENGADVSVLTGVPHYPGWTIEPQDRWRLRRTELRARFTVRRLRHFVPRTQSAVKRGLYELTFAVNVATQRTSKTPPDLVLAIVPSLLSAVAAQRIAARHGVPLVIWVQDLMGPAAAQSGIEGGDRVARYVGAIEKWVMNRAAHVVVINSRFQDYVRSIGVGAARTSIIPNWTHVAAPSDVGRSTIRTRLGWGESETVVLHSGNMGLKQDLSNVIAAARLADSSETSTVRFVLMGDGSQRRALQTEGAGVKSISFLPPAQENDFADVLAAADILLVNERPSSVDMCLPSKLTSYFRAARPVVAACSSRGGTAAEVARSAAGLVVPPGDPGTLLDAVSRLGDDPTGAAQMALSGSLYSAEHLDARATMGALSSILRRAVSATP